MKWWRLSSVLLAVSLTGCSVFDSGFTPTPPVWQAPARPQMVINAGGNDVTLVVSNAAVLPMSASTAAPPTLTMSHTATELTLNFGSKDFFAPNNHLTVAIPANLQVLTIQGGGNVRATALPMSLRQLNVAGSETVMLQGGSLPLQQVVLNHVKQASINGIKSHGLLASIRNCGPVTLNGNVGIRELQVSKSGRVSITWVDSKELLVQLTAKQQVFLAGVAGLLITNVQGHAHLDAKYLRADKAFVHTTQQGVAEVTVLDSLNAFASNQSNIYYYQQPKLVGRYYQDHGSILYMGEQPPPCLSPECAPMPSNLPG